jgi:predicted nucleic acid-binding protein
MLKEWLELPHPAAQRMAAGEPASVSAQAWFEFTCGPVSSSSVGEVLMLIEARILPITRTHAELAAQLFNLTGRKCTLQADVLIAAAAIVEKADLVTFNVQDFQLFVPMGLKLLPA